MKSYEQEDYQINPIGSSIVCLGGAPGGGPAADHASEGTGLAPAGAHPLSAAERDRLKAGRLEKAVPRLQWSDVGAASDHHGGESIVLFCGEETHVTDM